MRRRSVVTLLVLSLAACGGDAAEGATNSAADNQLLVRIEAAGMTMDEVEDAFDELDLP